MQEEEGEPPEEITKIEFESESLRIAKGSVNTVSLKVSPESRVSDCTVEYSVSDGTSQVISVTEESSAGCVIKGEGKGSVVLIARCEGITAYLEVDVYSDILSETPFISVPQTAYELKVGDKKSFQATLSGGELTDNALFKFTSTNDSIVTLQTADNTCMISCEKEGFAKICIDNPKSEIPCYVLVFVSEGETNPVYITSSSNVYIIAEKGGTQNIQVNLANSVNPNLSFFEYTVEEGSESVDIIYNNNVVSVTPKKTGRARIKVSHPDSLNSLDIYIIVLNEICPFYVDTKQSFFEMKIGQSARTEVFIGGDDEKTVLNPEFTCEVENTEICEVINGSGEIYIKAKKSGKTKIFVRNELCSNEHEIYVIVSGNEEYLYYISTVQNVIRMEEGEEGVELDISLAGGNEGDRNGFKWKVEDSSVCEVTTSFGQVSYARSSVYQGPDNLEAKAYIKGKKAGNTEITVTHPKSDTELKIKVMVYPEGSLSGLPPVLKGPSVVKVLKGSSQDVNLERVSGTAEGLEWQSDNTQIVSVSGNNLNGKVYGVGSGSCRVNVSRNGKACYSFVAVSGTQSELDSYNIMSFENSVVSLMAKSTGYYRINTDSDVYSNFTSAVSDSEVCEASIIDSVLCVKALKAGECRIIVTNTECFNQAVLIVNVYDELTVTKPYYFDYTKFASVLINQDVRLKASLIGSGAEDKGKISWYCDNNDCTLNSSAEECLFSSSLRGKYYVYAHSDKSASDAKFIVNVVETEAELGRVIIDVPKTNYLCKTGDDLFITAELSDMEQKGNITWECSDIGVVSINSNYENAVLHCQSEGDVFVTVKCGDALPVKIYISVRNNIDTDIPQIILPSYAEMEEEEIFTVNAVFTGLSSDDISKVQWSCEDTTVCSMSANGGVAYIRAVKEGYTVITASLPSKGIKSQCSIIVYKKGAVHLPLISLSKAYYSMETGESKDITLTFGSVKPSDSDIATLSWESISDSIKINANGAKATVTGVKEGKAEVTVKSPKFVNEIHFTVAVGKQDTNGYSFNGNHIVRMVKGEDFEYQFCIKDMFGSSISDYREITVSKENESDSFSCTVLQNSVMISSEKAGSYIMYISHPLVRNTMKVGIWVYDSEDDLNSSFVIMAEKDSILLRKGEEAVLKVEYAGDVQKTRNIKWSCENAGYVTYSISQDKLKLTVKGKKEGNCTFKASHDECKKDAVFNISVTEYSAESRKVSIVSPSVILMEKDRVEQMTYPEGYTGEISYVDFKYHAKVITNLSESEKDSLLWTSSDSSTVQVTGDGENAVFTGLKEGICEVTCRYDSYNYAVMVVKVCSTKDGYASSKLFNIDQRFISMYRGESRTVTPFTQYGLINLNNAEYENLSEGNSVKVSNEGGKLKIDALNEGVSYIKCSGPGMENEFTVTVMVSEKSGSVNEFDSTGYLTAARYIYSVNPDRPTECAIVSVMGVGIEEEKKDQIKWEVLDENVCLINGTGSSCYVYPLKEGSTVLTASSVWSSNTVKFKIISSKEDVQLCPCIKAEKNTVRLKAGEEGEIKFSLANVSETDVSKFSYENQKDNVCYIEGAGETLKIKGLSSGQSVVKVSYPGLDDVNVVVSVSGVVDNVVYLSTANAYNVTGTGSTIKVSVILNNYDEKNQNNFLWSVKSGGEYGSLSGSGSSVMVKGVKEGIMTLTCSHSKALAPIDITVNVIDSSDYVPVYMRTDTVVNITEGEKKTVEVELVNGSPAEEGNFRWEVNADSRAIVKVTYSGKQALIQGLSSGVGRITVTNPSCVSLPSIDIIVVVNEDETKDSLVIQTESTIIEGKLSDSYKTVNVNLVGGKAEQQLLFTWEIVSFDSVIRNSDGTSLSVVKLVSATGEQNIIKYLNEGTATVRVKNSATSYYLDIKFIINEYTSLAFEKPSLTIKQYESETVSITAPSSKTVVFNSSDESIARVYGTNSVCCIEGVKEGYAVITARTSDGSYEDRLSVRVNKSDKSVPLYISANTNLVTLDMSDTQGSSIKATLSGTIGGVEVSEDESNFLKWEFKSGGNSVLKFASANPLSVTGSEAKVLPVSFGSETIVISHPKTQRKKEVYVQVKSLSSSMTLDAVYGIFEKEDIGSITARLSGVPSSEESNIIWTTSDINTVSLTDNGNEAASVKGSNVVFKCKKLCEEGCIITASYRDIVKTYTVFIRALPSLHLMLSNDVIRSGQTKYYNIICTPDDYIGDLNYSFSSSEYVKTSENGKMMTGLIKNETEKAENGENPPAGIRVPYFKVTGGNREGVTQFFIECKNLTSTLNVKTDNTVNFNITSFDEYNERGIIVSHKDNPSVIEVRADSKFTRVYYNMEPEIDVMPLCVSEYTAALNNAFRSGTVRIVNGNNTGTTGRYFDLYPDDKGCNWGDVRLYAGSQNIGMIRVSFSMPDSDSAFSLIYQNNVPVNYRYDVSNAFITGCGKGTYSHEGSIPVMTVSYSRPYFYAIKDSVTDANILLQSDYNVFSECEHLIKSSNVYGSVIRQIERKKNPVCVKFYWPDGYGMTGTYSKYFIIYEEIRE